MSTPQFTGVSVPIADIDVGPRDRSDMGDLADLAASIDAVGMLHPIVITGDWRLVAGDRRLAAARDVLGWAEVPVTIVDLSSSAEQLRAEMDENTCRKPLSPVEAERARARRAAVLTEDAIRRAEEGRARGRATQAGQEPVTPNLGDTPKPEARTAKVAAIGTGYSGSTLDKVTSIRDVAEKGVIRIGSQELPAPEPVREAAKQAMDALAQPGAPVDRLHRQVAEAIEQHIEPDEEATRTRTLKRWRDALAAARPLREFDLHTLDGVLSDQDWELASPLIDELATQVEVFRTLRPTHLRVIRASGAS